MTSPFYNPDISTSGLQPPKYRPGDLVTFPKRTTNAWRHNGETVLILGFGTLPWTKQEAEIQGYRVLVLGDHYMQGHYVADSVLDTFTIDGTDHYGVLVARAE